MDNLYLAGKPLDSLKDPYIFPPSQWEGMTLPSLISDVLEVYLQLLCLYCTLKRYRLLIGLWHEG